MPAPDFIPLPDTASTCRERLVELQGEIASIKTQIATADIARQARRGALDAQWFHRAKTALRFKQQELARVSAHLAALAGDFPSGALQGHADRRAARAAPGRRLAVGPGGRPRAARQREVGHG
jgi:hypothetical protein